MKCIDKELAGTCVDVKNVEKRIKNVKSVTVIKLIIHK